MERKIKYFFKRYEEVLKYIQQGEYQHNAEEVINKEKYLINSYQRLDKESRQAVILSLKDMLGHSEQEDIYILTTIMDVEPSVEIIEEIIDRLMQEQWDWQTRNFVVGQIEHNLFVHCDIVNVEVRVKIATLYRKIVEEAREKCKMDLVKRPIEERNQDKVVVLSSQIIKIQHGPTKTSYDRCYTLINKMNKKILLMNSAEVLTLVGEIPFFHTYASNYVQEYLDMESVEYQGTKIPFFQCEPTLPNVADIKTIVKAIYDINPIYVVKIGGGSILNDVLNDYVPTITLSLCPSDLASIEGDYQVTGHKLTTSEKEFLSIMHKPFDHVIEGCFTWNLVEQKGQLTKAELGLPEDKFVIIVVGARLTVEVTDSFVKTLLDAVEDKGVIAFAGKMENYESYKLKYPDFEEKTRLLGFQTDMLAVLDHCDLYANPKRNGGGFSVVEAMSKGLPAVTLPEGDVAVGAGDDFIVQDYEEMKQTIKQYISDPTFYKSMSDKAKERSIRLCDTEGEFVKILKEAERRMR